MEPRWPGEGKECVTRINCVWKAAFTYDSKVCLNSGSQMQRSWSSYFTCQPCIRHGFCFSQEVKQHNNICSHFSRPSFPFSAPNCFLGVFGVALHPGHVLREVMNHYSSGWLSLYCTDVKTEKENPIGFSHLKSRMVSHLNFPSEE